MARLIVRQESRNLDEGVPARAVVGSMSVHAALLAFIFVGASSIDIPRSPTVYRVNLVAAPRPAPVREVPVPERTRVEPQLNREVREIETRPVPVETSREETPPAEAESEEQPVEERSEPAPEERPAAPPEQSSRGAEVPVRLEGAPFPFPEYLENIIVQIKRHWRPPGGGRQLRAELAFTINSDGSVENISWVRRSGNPSFDLEARGAIEAAGRRRAFGPLPEDYMAEQLRVSFFFDPTRY